MMKAKVGGIGVAGIGYKAADVFQRKWNKVLGLY